jgi:DhnA family fructose-bisphosphate aldolase class Ia
MAIDGPERRADNPPGREIRRKRRSPGVGAPRDDRQREAGVGDQRIVSGSDIRLGRLFDRDSGRSFIAAFDHGLTLGPKPGSEDALAVLDRIIAGGPDGILISPGMMKLGGRRFAVRGAPAPIVRADWIYNSEVYPALPAILQDPRQGEHYEVICSPEDALALGANAITMFLIVGAAEGAAFAGNVREVARHLQAARRAGIPVIVEAVLWGARMEDKRDPELLAFAARVAAELGADAIKTAYTGDPESMRQVVAGCPVPVLVLGGVRSASPDAVLDATRGALAAGAKGVVYGRNVWQADDPAFMCGLLRDVIHEPAAVPA